MHGQHRYDRRTGSRVQSAIRNGIRAESRNGQYGVGRGNLGTYKRTGSYCDGDAGAP